jgi:hypothetical protein
VLGQVCVVVCALGIGEGHENHVAAFFEGHVFGFAVGWPGGWLLVIRAVRYERLGNYPDVPVAFGKAAPMSWIAYLFGQLPASWLMKSGSRRYLRRVALV